MPRGAKNISLKEHILGLGLKPGDTLAPENELARELGVSRHRIRSEALALTQAGILRKTPRRGTVIDDGGGFEGLGEILNFQLRLAGSNDLENWEARRVIEPALLPLAIRRIAPAQIGELIECIDEMERHQDNPRLADRADYRFHRLLLTACGNRTLEAFAVILQALFREDYRAETVPPEAHKLAVEEHRGVLAAIVAEDTGLAVERLRRHLTPPPAQLKGKQS